MIQRRLRVFTGASRLRCLPCCDAPPGAQVGPLSPPAQCALGTRMGAPGDGVNNSSTSRSISSSGALALVTGAPEGF